jgi:hypothetical protein
MIFQNLRVLKFCCLRIHKNLFAEDLTLHETKQRLEPLSGSSFLSKKWPDGATFSVVKNVHLEKLHSYYQIV